VAQAVDSDFASIEHHPHVEPMAPCIKRPRFTPGALFCVWDCGIVWVLLRRGKQTRSVPWWISWDSDPALEGRR